MHIQYCPRSQIACTFGGAAAEPSTGPAASMEYSHGPTMTAVARHANLTMHSRCGLYFNAVVTTHGRQKQTQTPEIQCGSTELRDPATPTSGSQRGGENADGTGGNETGPYRRGPRQDSLWEPNTQFTSHA
ncbi:hypothetical protein B0H10DRAFT_1966588 [Mycena sp. CBHHK59/15]|nr:hypothetical protein B0H10DRAFT_1966588 [Mycena sp. CBHHK59/15]